VPRVFICIVRHLLNLLMLESYSCVSWECLVFMSMRMWDSKDFALYDLVSRIVHSHGAFYY
jgi:hypothetical protein